MNRKKIVLWMLILSATSSFAYARSHKVDEEVPVANAGFEEGEVFPGTMFPGWNVYSTDKTMMALTGESQRTGEYSAKFVTQNTGSQFQGMTQRVPIDASQKYTISVYAKSCVSAPLKGTAYGQLVVEWLGADGGEISRVWSDKWNQSLVRKQWKRFSIKKVTPPDGTVAANVGVHLFEGKSGGRGAFYIDDVSVLVD